MNKTEQVARLLLARIIEDGLSPGDSFGTETDLLKQFDVSRPTLREGLRVLESQGVLSMRPGPGGGIIVARPGADVIAHLVSVFLRLNKVPFAEILRTRLAIEPILVRDAALHGDETHFAEMEATILRMEAPDCTDDGFYHENRQFHGTIARASGNPVLELFWNTISILASGEGTELRYTRRNRAHIIEAHRRILEACRSHKPETAQREMAAHLGELEELIRSRYRGKLSQPPRISYRPGRIPV